MDHLRLFSGKKDNLTNLISFVEKFSNDIRLKFRIDKCKAVIMEKG